MGEKGCGQPQQQQRQCCPTRCNQLAMSAGTKRTFFVRALPYTFVIQSSAGGRGSANETGLPSFARTVPGLPQVAGFRDDVGRAVMCVLCDGAGHIVPATRPAAGMLMVLKSYLPAITSSNLVKRPPRSTLTNVRFECGCIFTHQRRRRLLRKASIRTLVPDMGSKNNSNGHLSYLT